MPVPGPFQALKQCTHASCTGAVLSLPSKRTRTLGLHSAFLLCPSFVLEPCPASLEERIVGCVLMPGRNTTHFRL